MNDNFISRRKAIASLSSGFGSVALSGMLHNELQGGVNPAAKAKTVILLYMSGGVSQVDTFDPKPRLNTDHGKPMPMKVERTQFNANGNIFGSPFSFKRYGKSGLEFSDIFTETAAHADDIAIVRSMTTSVNEHAQGNFLAHTGFPFLGHPTAGSWISYGLGSANQNLPSYVVLQSGKAVPPHGGVGLFSSGFLPAQHQASILKADAKSPVPNISPARANRIQRARLDFVSEIDQQFAKAMGGVDKIEAAIKNYETAYRMQTAVPEICDISGESKTTLDQYGITDTKDPEMASYGRQALLARRLVEQGVRFIELSCLTRGVGAGGAANPWDQHGELEKGHRLMAHQVDKPIAALISDLKQRGLLDSTLLVFTGEFGRTPFSQGSNGRDHNPYGFSIWLAGGGIKGGQTYGATDELGYHVVDKPTTFFDLWATVLHQLGINHEDFTYRYAGRDVRLTDVHGNVWKELV
ncbi:MAG: DUF1501 domain-containing protein [Verrucomicrobiales bacterium]|nr:DUF1501 domain-containing protein [Verrucomicrobiales bacterium]